jgi:hypothetical protein
MTTVLNNHAGPWKMFLNSSRGLHLFGLLPISINLITVILNLFQNLWIAVSYETLKQVQGDIPWFRQQPVLF